MTSPRGRTPRCPAPVGFEGVTRWGSPRYPIDCTVRPCLPDRIPLDRGVGYRGRHQAPFRVSSFGSRLDEDAVAHRACRNQFRCGDIASWQRLAGNAAVSRLIEGAGPQPSSLVGIGRARATVPPGMSPALAGTPAAQAAPGGFRSIQARRMGPASFSDTAGLTLVPNAGAFSPPAYLVGGRPIRPAGAQVTVFKPEVDATQVRDVVHVCLYPAPGDHDRFDPPTQVIGGRTWRHVLRISQQESNRIRAGEQEHLNDARRAFELTYLAIATAINQVSVLDLPPRASRDRAIQSANAALALRLPAAIPVEPRVWPGILTRLLRATNSRDTNGWHTVDYRPGSVRERRTGKIVWRLDLSGLQLGTPSSQVINL